MIEQKSLIRMEAQLSKLMAQKMGHKSGPFDKRLAKSLRRAPASVKKAAQGFTQARQLTQHPKLRHQVDGPKLQVQFATLVDYLTRIDVADRRRGLILSTLGSVSFGLLVVFAAFMAWLIWRGYL
ncbi:hypothetical protein [Thalassovita sp.]|uniref:hypothetical protein n=1 Tax=Thalassovita sp. TaxID=1979401 RepID=UPI003B5CDF3E